MDHDEMAARIAAVPLFAHLDAPELSSIAGRLKEVHFEAGRAIATQGDRASGST